MKCIYCQQDCKQHLWDAKYPNLLTQQWICDPCNAYFQTTSNNKIQKIWWYNIEYKKKFFKATLNYQDSFFGLYINTAKENPYSYEPILEWNFVPDWTPLTVASKLQNLLVFS